MTCPSDKTTQPSPTANAVLPCGGGRAFTLRGMIKGKQMNDQKPGYFQTYPDAIKGILGGIITMAIFVWAITWMLHHPIGALRLYAGAGFFTLAILASRSAHGFNKLGKGLIFTFVLSLGVLAVRSWWL